MGQYLISRGHRRIAHVTGPSFLNNSLRRQAGFDAALKDNGIAVDASLHFEGTFLSRSGYAAVEWLLATHAAAMPSAIFFAGSRMARAGLAALADRRLRIPDDIAVATYDIIDEMTDIRPRLTTIGVEPSKLGRGAVRLLRERLSGDYAGPPRQVVLPARLEIHATA
jgi:LacI family transcriptional regulator